MKKHKLLIKCPEDNNDSGEEESTEITRIHPHCAHGPALLFYRENESPSEGYFACAAHRDKRECSFHLSATDPLIHKYIQSYYSAQIAPLAQQYRHQRQQVAQRLTNSGERLHYCLHCNVPFVPNMQATHSDHVVERNLSTTLLSDPTQFLLPMEDNKVQAQYFFDAKALQFFGKCFEDLDIKKVICIGAPRMHAYLRRHCPHIASFLLDMDARFFNFYDDDSFAWYNMCNNHFFLSEQMQAFKQFIKKKDENDHNLPLLFTDPPFGCRTEPIAHTLQQLQRQYNRVNELPHQPLPVIWIFPYYSGHYIKEVIPSLEMCDYKINYTNHLVYTDNVTSKIARKMGSPVRMFTNIPLSRLTLPQSEGYSYCSDCDRYTAIENQHCDICECCPAKSGGTYRHCADCGVCVKPYYVHCFSCRRCTQATGHNCLEYQAQQFCYICRQRGHIENNCKAWKSWTGTKRVNKKRTLVSEGIICLLCGCRSIHNERNCPKRSRFISEATFMGETRLEYFKRDSI